MSDTISMDENSDAALWTAACAGDERAFGALFDRHVDRVYRHARRYTPNREDAEDITGMVFLEAWRLRSRVRLVDGSPIGWLLVTTANIARNGARSRTRYEQLLRGLRPEAVPDHADGVIEAETRAQRRDEVEVAFARLRPRDQEILALCVVEEIAPVDVARLLRLPAGTVRTRLSRAKDRLRIAMVALASDDGVQGRRLT